jgi:hypothetical protein
MDLKSEIDVGAAFVNASANAPCWTGPGFGGDDQEAGGEDVGRLGGTSAERAVWPAFVEAGA